MRSALLALLAASVLSAGCKSSTSPSTTTTTTTTTTSSAASPTTTDTFTGVVGVGDRTSFPFSVGVYGTVNVIFNGVSGPKVPATVSLQIGIGTVDGSGVCNATNLTLAKPATSVALSVVENPGTYCLNVADVGNLNNPATVNLSVAHP